MESVPYHEKSEDGYFERTFAEDIPSEELKWHFDDENRIIIPTKGFGWKIQIDELLPVELIIGVEYFIPVDVYHRIIKGTDDLELKLYKLDSIKREIPKYKRTHYDDINYSDNMLFHVKNEIKLYDNIFRYSSDAWCDLIQEAKELYSKGLIELDEEELELIKNDSGKTITKDGIKYILNTPFKNGDLNSQFEYFVYVCDENNEIKKIEFNEENT